MWRRVRADRNRGTNSNRSVAAGMAVDNSNREAVVDREAIAAAAALVGSVEANPPVDRLVVTEAHPPPLLEADLKADVAKLQAGAQKYLADLHAGELFHVYNSERSLTAFNPSTAFLKFEGEDTGSLTTAIDKADLAICISNWVIFWWAYALNLIFGDLLDWVFTIVANWVTKHLGTYVKNYFADIFTVKA